MGTKKWSAKEKVIGRYIGITWIVREKEIVRIEIKYSNAGAAD